MAGFHLSIDSLEEFTAFVVLIRDETPDDPAKLQALTNKVKAEREGYEAAVSRDNPVAAKEEK